MTDSIVSALIGSSGAIMAGAFIFWLDRRAQSRQERRKIVSELNGRISLQYRLFLDKIANETWYNFYYAYGMGVRKIEGVDLSVYIENVNRRLTTQKELENRLMDNEIEMIKLLSVHSGFYPDDSLFDHLAPLFIADLSKKYETDKFVDLDVHLFDLDQMNNIVGGKIQVCHGDFGSKVEDDYNRIVSLLDERMYQLRVRGLF